MFNRFNVWVGTLVGRIEELKNEEGQALVEYGLILALIAVVCVVALTALGVNISAKLTDIGTKIAAA
jgi:pilus assembly protein Flp/PilA